MGSNEALKNQLNSYKAKFYKNKAIKGAIVFGALLILSFLLINTIEYSGRLGNAGRAILLYGFILLNFAVLYSKVIKNLMLLNKSGDQLSNEEAAEQIGKHFPEVSDKLLNIIQLESLSDKDNELLQASIRQKSTEIQHIPFVNAIDLKANRKYLRYIYAPGSIVVLLLLFLPQFITESSTRIINYNNDFQPEAPFKFLVQNNQLNGFKDEPFTIDINTEGRSNPENVFVVINERKIKAEKINADEFSYKINRLRQKTTFKLESEGVLSEEYTIDVFERPSISLFNIDLDFPEYTKIKDEQVQNSGNLTVPEGTNIRWIFNTKETESLAINFDSDSLNLAGDKKANDVFEVNKTLSKSSAYSIQLQNQYSGNKDSLLFQVEVIKDRFPEINLDQFQDTVLYKNVVLGGKIKDDYGFNRLTFHYSYDDSNYEFISIPINKSLNDQSYYHIFTLDSAKIQAGSELKYYMQISDNDAVNGSKTNRSATYSFKIPSKEELEEEIEKSSQQIQQKVDESLKQAEELNRKIEEADERLKTKKEMDWQDEKLMQEILDQKEKLAQQMEQLKKENELNNSKQNQFQPQSEELKQKMKQLQDIMNNVLDDELKKMYDELRELLEENADIEEFRDQMQDLRENSQNLEEDLERTLELFKKLEFDKKLENSIEDLEEEIEDQEELSKETESGEKSNEELADEQEKALEDLEKLEEELKKLEELNQERKNPDPLPDDLDEQLEDIKEEQEKAQESLEEESSEEENGEKEEENEEGEQGEEQESKEGQQKQSQSRQNAAKSQKRATGKMQELKQSLENMQSAAQMEQQQENLEHLRDLVDNLVTLSFNQENLMNEFKEIRQSDPRYVKLSQDQLKLQDDSKIIQDSLVSLSQRVFQISSFVMKELAAMNFQMSGAVETLKEKRISQAVGKQQFAMTSINNLALLLDDIVQQMQEQMANQMMSPGNGKKGNKNKPQMGGLSDLQRQLSEQIKELKESGKTGRQLSEELAQLASQQERLRNALENFETGLDGNKLGEKIDKLIDQMEENEWDLINKNITDETVQRQQEMLTRLLEAENSIQERGEDDERKGRSAENYELSIPESLNEYLKAKEKEIELLRTIPAKLNPYYKKETSKYFKKIKENN
ncbi:coiled-coil domain-containing protein [Roseivirga misakiensis]|uniref:ATPase n=1 Tax=Roseivirga misakiensis TaxID=1563681 RepID=A0A1E5T6T5_9BACT|nr:DUF4175 family protein [Roseivirga misakiensis]OEK07089.1 hypothetical protein BFP71_05370 [Roseivirga misakiensis]